MSFTVSFELLSETKHPSLEKLRASRSYTDRDCEIDTSKHAEDVLRDLMSAAKAVNDGKSQRALEAILEARSGQVATPVPNFKAFREMLSHFLAHDVIDGWIYVQRGDGNLYPELVTAVTSETGYRNEKDPTVTLHTWSFTIANRSSGRLAAQSNAHVFRPSDVSRKRLPDILSASGLFKETGSLREQYVASMQRFRSTVSGQFAKQFRATGKAFSEYQSRSGERLENRRVVHDLENSDYGANKEVDSYLFDDGANGGHGVVPEHPLVYVFDLRTHASYWVHSDFLTPNVYDKSLGDKLILPATHRGLLDVLTTDLSAFVEDIVEGKSAGNVVLCQGVPGVGKTLTAEVYAELTERPLYAVHSGTLGTTAKSIEANLKVVFERARRFNAVTLIDEADVFVVERGENIEQNAIVAEFLRTLEYFDGLLFLTTNRSGKIDDAIISRCAAIIDYHPPGAEDAAKIWHVMAAQNKIELSQDIIDALVLALPGIAPRDVKMLLRLALRIATSKQEPLTLETFRMCSMFRGLNFVLPESVQ
jgi:hypothetical protein